MKEFLPVFLCCFSTHRVSRWVRNAASPCMAVSFDADFRKRNNNRTFPAAV